MNIFFNRKTIRLYLMVGIVLSLSSCHSKYLTSKVKPFGPLVWKSDGSAFAFLEIKSLYRQPEGISAFPDGGRVSYVYNSVALYYFDIKAHKLNRVVDFDDVSQLYSNTQFKYMKIVFDDSLLYYKLGEPHNADVTRIKKQARTKEDFLKLEALIAKEKKAYVYNLNTKKISEVDPKTFETVFSQRSLNENLRNRGKTYLSKLSFSDWGIILHEIYPQSKKTYKEYLVYMKGNSQTINAIFEQIVPEFTKKEIHEMLTDMDRYKIKIDKKSKSSIREKDHLMKLRYDEYYESTYKRLQSFL